AVRELCQLADQMIGSIIAMPGCIGEADQVRQGIVPEEGVEARARKLVGTIVRERVRSHGRTAQSQTAPQHVGTACGPLEAAAVEQLQSSAADGAFGWPAASRSLAKGAIENP